MLGSLKNSSSVESPNFTHEKLKMLGIEFRFDRKMRSSMESQPSLLLLIDCGERTKKLEALYFVAVQCLLSGWL